MILSPSCPQWLWVPLTLLFIEYHGPEHKTDCLLFLIRKHGMCVWSFNSICNLETWYFVKGELPFYCHMKKRLVHAELYGFLVWPILQVEYFTYILTVSLKMFYLCEDNTNHMQCLKQLKLSLLWKKYQINQTSECDKFVTNSANWRTTCITATSKFWDKLILKVWKTAI